MFNVQHTISRSHYVSDAEMISVFNMFSLLLELSCELQRRAARCPGFLHAAVLSYVRLLQIYLDGLEIKAASELSSNQVTEIPGGGGGSFYTCKVSFFFADVISGTRRQVESFQILSPAKRFLLRVISQTPPASLSSRQLTQVT